MKSLSSVQLAAIAGVLSMAPLAMAQSLCAVTCFQNVVTEHPPLDCTEDNMYLCFCVSPELQSYFVDCAYADCGDGAQEAINFGVGLCSDLGEPITIPPRPATSTTAAVETEPTSASTVDEPSQPDTTSTDEPSAPEPTTAAPDTTTEQAVDTTEAPSVSESSSATESPAEESPVPEESEVSVTVPSTTLVPTGNSTTPTPNEPTHVDTNMGNNMKAASGLVIAATLAITALNVVF